KLAAGEPDLVPQRPQQRGLARHVDVLALSVDVECDHRALLSAVRACTARTPGPLDRRPTTSICPNRHNETTNRARARQQQRGQRRRLLLPGIFISYRRDDSGPMARRLYELLCARFGTASVFIDVETIEAGSDFAEVIDAKVGFCDGFVAIIGKTWASAVDAAGRRRLDDPADWGRAGVAAALARGAKVVPVPVAGAPRPSAADLPRPRAPPARHRALALRPRRAQAP